jgi:hypothetical protein
VWHTCFSALWYRLLAVKLSWWGDHLLLHVVIIPAEVASIVRWHIPSCRSPEAALSLLPAPSTKFTTFCPKRCTFAFYAVADCRVTLSNDLRLKGRIRLPVGQQETCTMICTRRFQVGADCRMTPRTA